MKLLMRFIGLCVCAVIFGFTFFVSARPVFAGCITQFAIDSVTAYRDHIIIDFTYSTAGSSPIPFNVSDNGTSVGSGTFSSPTPGSFTIEFDLDSSVVQELDSLKVDASPHFSCTVFSAVAMATGFFYTTGGTQHIRPQCADGRINNNNCDKIAIFPVKDEDSFGIQVYIVDHKTVPEFVLFVSATDLNALPANPDKVITIATSKNGLVVLYKHPNGDYQVNYGPDFEGKVFSFRFKGLPATTYEASTFMIGALLSRFTPEIG